MNLTAHDLYDEGNGKIAIGDIQGAADCYQESVKLDKTFFDGWHALGMALMILGKTKEAIGAALMATDISPNDLLAWTSLSQMYIKDGQIAEAESAKSNATIIGIGGKIKPDKID